MRVQRLPADKLRHPYQKPTELIVQLIQASSDRGDLVADWFFGSGTTALACIKTGRRFIGCEVDPQYFEIACERIRYVLSDKKVLGKYR